MFFFKSYCWVWCEWYLYIYELVLQEHNDIIIIIIIIIILLLSIIIISLCSGGNWDISYSPLKYFQKKLSKVPLSGIWSQDHCIPWRCFNRLSLYAINSTRSQSQPCTATPISSLCSVFTLHLGLCLRQSPQLLEAKSRTGNHVVAEWIVTYGIYHWRIFRSSYSKLPWRGCQSMTP